MIEISSNQNPLIKEIKSLNRKKNRWENRLFIIEGIKIIEEAIINGIKIKSIFISEKFLESKDGLVFYVELKNLHNLAKVSDPLFKSISDTENPQGILAVCEFNIRDFYEIDNLEKPSMLFLDGVQDPGNMGTIIRTADAFNMDGIILGEGCVDPYNPKVVRSTMGSIFRVPLYICKNSIESLQELKIKGFHIFATSLNGKSLYDADFDNKFLCVIGNEANGVNPKILDIAERRIKIPMPGNAESLNAGVAASIIMYEAMRSRNIYL
ncbi:MAG: RNA methyltransferase [Tissierellaceae bacterium]|nr:RNA methyltransferase [Tissierellaceae bacterium]